MLGTLQVGILERLASAERRLNVLENAFDTNTSVFSDSVSTLDIKVAVIQRLLGDVPVDHGPSSVAERFHQYYLEYLAMLGLVEFMLMYKKWQESQPQETIVEFGG